MIKAVNLRQRIITCIFGTLKYRVSLGSYRTQQYSTFQLYVYNKCHHAFSDYSVYERLIRLIIL